MLSEWFDITTSIFKAVAIDIMPIGGDKSHIYTKRKLKLSSLCVVNLMFFSVFIIKYK